MSVTLCGLPRCGKSSVGLLLAKKMKMAFMDTDHLIEALFQAKERLSLPWNCHQIFTQKGEVFFRQLEKEVIASLVHSQAVIASGGGAFFDETNCQFFHSLGPVIYLTAPLEVIFRRLIADRMPAFLNPDHPFESFQKLAAKRSPLYEATADYIVQIGEDSPEKIAERLYRLLLSTNLEK